MKNLAIGVITLKRPDSLARLLAGIAAQKFDQVIKPEITVVIVDNDMNGSARSVCDEAVKAGMKVSYILEPKLGIPIARNRVLDGLPDDAEGLAWIDDDEVPAENWLESLILTQAGTSADVVMGAIEAVLPEGTPDWVKKGGFFNRRRFVDRASLTEGATNNCLVMIAPMRESGVRFDEKLRFAGGTDTLFFRELAAKDVSIVWSPAAIAREYIPLERCTLRWMIKRHFRSGNTLAICDWKIDGIRGAITRIGQALLKMFQGLINLPVSFEGKHEFARSVLMFARSFGMIAGVFGYRFEEFKPLPDTRS